MMRAVLLITLNAVAGLGCAGCSQEEASRPDVGDATSDVPDQGQQPDSGAFGKDAANPECSVPAPPPGLVPEGWVPFTDYSCETPLYIPQTRAQLPIIEWEPCGSEAPTGIACRRMKLLAPELSAGSRGASVVRVADGSYRIAFGRGGGIAPPTTVIVATLDGEVHFAAMSTVPIVDGLSVGPAGVDQQHFGLRLRGGVEQGKHADDQPRKGLLVGTVGELRPRLHLKEEAADVPSWTVNDHYVERSAALGQTVDLTPLAGGATIQLFRGADDPDGCQVGPVNLVGKDAIFEVGNLRYAGIMAYDPVRGTHPLIRWYGDNTKGAMGVGTDGKDLVWTLGTDHPVGEGIYATRSLMTSGYSTDPEYVATHARRLRSNPVGLERMVVGCGYTAHVIAGTKVESQVQVVRLSDGYAWKIGVPTGGWSSLLDAIGVTCDEVFFQANTRSAGTTYGNIYRVRIDSLGAATPPD